MLSINQPKPTKGLDALTPKMNLWHFLKWFFMSLWHFLFLACIYEEMVFYELMGLPGGSPVYGLVGLFCFLTGSCCNTGSAIYVQAIRSISELLAYIEVTTSY